MATKREQEEQLALLLGQSRQAGQELSALRAEIVRLKNLLNGVWSLLRDRNGLKDEDLLAAVKRIVEVERITGRTTESCPHCNRPLQDRANLCIYCGHVVERRELF